MPTARPTVPGVRPTVPVVRPTVPGVRPATVRPTVSVALHNAYSKAYCACCEAYCAYLGPATVRPVTRTAAARPVTVSFVRPGTLPDNMITDLAYFLL